MKRTNIIITITSALIVLSLVTIGIAACLACDAATWEKVVGIALLAVVVGFESIIFYGFIWDWF